MATAASRGRQGDPLASEPGGDVTRLLLQSDGPVGIVMAEARPPAADVVPDIGTGPPGGAKAAPLVDVRELMDYEAPDLGGRPLQAIGMYVDAPRHGNGTDPLPPEEAEPTRCGVHRDCRRIDGRERNGQSFQIEVRLSEGLESPKPHRVTARC